MSQLFLGVFVCLQLSVYLLVSSMGLWIDQLVNGAIARISSFTAIYLALFIFTIIVSSRLLCTQCICADQMMAYIAGPSTLDINGTCTSMFHVTTSTQYTFASPSSTGLVRRPSRNEAHHDRIPPHRLRLPCLLVHHVLLPGVPLDMDPVAVLRQPDRRSAAGSRCNARSGRSLLEELPYGVEAVPYVLFLHAHVHSFTWVLI